MRAARVTLQLKLVIGGILLSDVESQSSLITPYTIEELLLDNILCDGLEFIHGAARHISAKKCQISKRKVVLELLETC